MEKTTNFTIKSIIELKDYESEIIINIIQKLIEYFQNQDLKKVDKLTPKIQDGIDNVLSEIISDFEETPDEE